MGRDLKSFGLNQEPNLVLHRIWLRQRRPIIQLHRKNHAALTGGRPGSRRFLIFSHAEKGAQLQSVSQGPLRAAEPLIVELLVRPILMKRDQGVVDPPPQRAVQLNKEAEIFLVEFIAHDLDLPLPVVCGVIA